MARITVEDCNDKVHDTFELVLLAAHRARQISNGDSIHVQRDKDKNTVIALREIAEDKVSTDKLLESLIKSHQRAPEVDVSHEEENPGREVADNQQSAVQDTPLNDGFVKDAMAASLGSKLTFEDVATEEMIE